MSVLASSDLAAGARLSSTRAFSPEECVSVYVLALRDEDVAAMALDWATMNHRGVEGARGFARGYTEATAAAGRAALAEYERRRQVGVRRT